MVRLLLFSSLLAEVAWANGPTSIFINQVSEYALLSSCAQIPVSSIVRDMVYGCGDNSQTTSYVCFCYESSAIFSSIISKHVSITCSNDTAEVSTALDVFSSYCELGKLALATMSSTTTLSSTPSPAPASTTAPPTSTSTTTGTPMSSPSSSSKHTAAIAAGVTIPVCVIAVGGLAVFFWWKRKQTRNRNQKPAELADDRVVPEMVAQLAPKELTEETAKLPPQELDGFHDAVGEIPGEAAQEK